MIIIVGESESLERYILILNETKTLLFVVEDPVGASQTRDPKAELQEHRLHRFGSGHLLDYYLRWICWLILLEIVRSFCSCILDLDICWMIICAGFVGRYFSK